MNKRRVSNPSRAVAKSKKSLNTQLFVQDAVPATPGSIRSEKKFDELPIQSRLKNTIRQIGFVNLTEIQEKTFDVLLDGKNLIGIANTGTGKTGAFLIPIIERLLRNTESRFTSLVIVPTRELALQVQEEFQKMSEGLNLKSVCLIGGTSVQRDVQNLGKRLDLVIGTPGRLLDLSDRGNLKLAAFEVLVLDEFDKMLDMGFVRDIRKITSSMAGRKQTMLFSATQEGKLQSIIDELVSNPVVVEVSSGDKSSGNVKQNIIEVKQGEDKYQLLVDLISDKRYPKVILFTDTKRLANKLSNQLNQSGINSDQIHGNKSQNYRVNALGKFKRGSIRVLVATDIAARGIDVDDVSLVVNYQAPTDYDTYIHRVGRTGRAGKTGTAYTFVG